MVDKDEIIQLLKNTKLTQAQIANRLGLSVQRISQINTEHNIRQQNTKKRPTHPSQPIIIFAL